MNANVSQMTHEQKWIQFVSQLQQTVKSYLSQLPALPTLHQMGFINMQSNEMQVMIYVVKNLARNNWQSPQIYFDTLFTVPDYVYIPELKSLTSLHTRPHNCKLLWHIQSNVKYSYLFCWYTAGVCLRISIRRWMGRIRLSSLPGCFLQKTKTHFIVQKTRFLSSVSAYCEIWRLMHFEHCKFLIWQMLAC